MGAEALKTAEGKWWDWLNPSRGFLPDVAPDTTRKQFFSELVKRCVLVESLSPLVTTQVLLAAVDQFATVLAIKLLRPPQLDVKKTDSGVLPNHSGMAVLEMQKPIKADVVVTQLQEYMLMVGGMPRPARAQLAKAAMLVDHPCNRKRTPVDLKIVKNGDQNSDIYIRKRQKFLEHLKAATYLSELQEREEEELHGKQERSYKDLKDKYNRIKGNVDLRDLRREYNMPLRR